MKSDISSASRARGGHSLVLRSKERFMMTSHATRTKPRDSRNPDGYDEHEIRLIPIVVPLSALALSVGVYMIFAAVM